MMEEGRGKMEEVWSYNTKKKSSVKNSLNARF